MAGELTLDDLMESPDDEFSPDTEIRHCLSMAREVLMDESRPAEDRTTLADSWMHLAESWSERSVDLYEPEDEEEIEEDEEIELPPVRSTRNK